MSPGILYLRDWLTFIEAMKADALCVGFFFDRCRTTHRRPHPAAPIPPPPTRILDRAAHAANIARHDRLILDPCVWRANYRPGSLRRAGRRLCMAACSHPSDARR